MHDCGIVRDNLTIDMCFSRDHYDTTVHRSAGKELDMVGFQMLIECHKENPKYLMKDTEKGV